MKKLVSVILTAVLLASMLSVGVSAAQAGDVNKDGKVNSSDALVVLQYSVGIKKSIDKKAADMNSDGKINSSDALVILQIAVGLDDGNNAKYKAEWIFTAKVKSSEYDSSDVIKVKRGDTVRVTLSLKNNYYAGPLCAQIFYNSKIFSGAPEGSFNTNGRLYATCGKNNVSCVDWDRMPEPVRNVGWPAYSEAKLKDFKSEHHFLRMTMTPDAGISPEAAKNINEELLTITFNVSKTARRGTEGQIILPVESHRTSQNRGGYFFLGIFTDGDVTKPAISFTDELRFNCAEAVLNFKVV